MEEKNKKEELKQILEDIKKALALYNSIDHERNLKIVNQNEQQDVRDVFVCVYDDKCVGLFKKIDWNCGGYGKDTGSIYVGVDSNYIGMKKTHDSFSSVNKWQPAGTSVHLCSGRSSGRYVANCDMQDSMSFDDMRLIMYNAGQIESYEIGKATSQEKLAVLKYAFNYYQLDKSVQNENAKGPVREKNLKETL